MEGCILKIRYKIIIVITSIAGSCKSTDLPLIIATKTPVSLVSTSISPSDDTIYTTIRDVFYEKIKFFCSDSNESDATEGRIYQENLCAIAEIAVKEADLISNDNPDTAIGYLAGFELGFFQTFLLSSHYYNKLIDFLI